MKNTDTDINGTLRVQDDGLAPSIGAQAIHILARLLSESVIRRDGDQLEGRSYPPITLTRSDTLAATSAKAPPMVFGWLVFSANQPEGKRQ